MSQEEPLGKDLNLRFEILENSGTLLRVHYEAENVSSSDLYLFNRLWHGYDSRNVFHLDPNLVYISVQDNSVRLLKGIHDIPKNMFVEMPIVPCTTLLPRGQRMSETFEVTLPLRQLNPYKDKERPVIDNPSSIIFSLGYFPAIFIGNRPVNPVKSNMGQALYAYVVPKDQLVVSTAPIPFTRTGAPALKAKFCPKCGAPVQPDNKFCSQCGSLL